MFGGWISFERVTFECPGACSCVVRYFLNYITSLLFILLIITSIIIVRHGVIVHADEILRMNVSSFFSNLS